MQQRIQAEAARAFLAAAGLAGTAGWVDGIAYVSLHAYVGNMTGAVVLLGLAGAELDLPGAGRQVLTLCAFLAGLLLSRLLRRLGWGPAPCYGLSALVVLACTGPLGAGPLAVAALAVAMGLQNAANTVFAGVGLNTTFMTGDLQRFAEAMLPDAATPDTRRGFARRLLPAVVLTYAAGAACGVLALRHLAAPLLPPGLALAAAAGLALVLARPRAA